MSKLIFTNLNRYVYTFKKHIVLWKLIIRINIIWCICRKVPIITEICSHMNIFLDKNKYICQSIFLSWAIRKNRIIVSNLVKKTKKNMKTFCMRRFCSEMSVALKLVAAMLLPERVLSRYWLCVCINKDVLQL